MVLFNIEFQVISTGHIFICKVVGTSENVVVQDIVSQVGEIRGISLYRQSEVHRITGTIRNKIIEKSLLTEPTRGKGRPKKYDW
ncbi:MAG: hypothetical protein NT047_11660 [Deltaproteobacteria bacterium]|nr:hypothetical protein [Deltaproteobacteria bacterium]